MGVRRPRLPGLPPRGAEGAIAQLGLLQLGRVGGGVAQFVQNVAADLDQTDGEHDGAVDATEDDGPAEQRRQRVQVEDAVMGDEDQLHGTNLSSQ